MASYSIRKGEARAATIARVVEAEYAKGTALAEVRRILASGPLGGDASIYYGTADPVYYRADGLANPLTDGKGNVLLATPEKPLAPATLRSAVRRRRDSGVRWNVLAASIEASIGRRVSEAEAKALYAKAGGDLDSSYVGRGTRKGAPATYADLASAVEGKTSDA